MPSTYTIVQFVPDPVSDERINIGAIAVDESGAQVRFLGNWDRVRAFSVGRQDVTFLRDFAKRIAQAVAHPDTLFPEGEPPKMTAEILLRMSARWTNSIQFTEPRASLREASALLDDIAPRYLVDSTPKKRGFRDRRAAAQVATYHVRQALERRVGVQAEELLKTRYPVYGQRQPHKFDAVIANGRPYLAAQGLSFEVPELKHIQTNLDALAWSIADVRASNRSLPIAILALPPKEDAPEYEKRHELFLRTSHVYRDIGADVLGESEIEAWADEHSAF